LNPSAPGASRIEAALASHLQTPGLAAAGSWKQASDPWSAGRLLAAQSSALVHSVQMLVGKKSRTAYPLLNPA